MNTYEETKKQGRVIAMNRLIPAFASNFEVFIHVILLFWDYNNYFYLFLIQATLFALSKMKWRSKITNIAFKFSGRLLLLWFFKFHVFALPLLYDFNTYLVLNRKGNNTLVFVLGISIIYSVYIAGFPGKFQKDFSKDDFILWIIFWSYCTIMFIIQLNFKIYGKRKLKLDSKQKLRKINSKFIKKKNLMEKFLVSFQSAFLDIQMMGDANNELLQMDKHLTRKEIREINTAFWRANERIYGFLNVLNLVVHSDKTTEMKLKLEGEGMYKKLKTKLGFLKKMNHNPDVDVVLDIQKDIPPLVCDFSKITQIIINLYSNSLKYCKKGTIILRTSYTKETQIFAFSVIDTGPGIESTTNSNKNVYSNGTGKEVCDEIIKLLNGKIEESFNEGQTITFSCKLEPSFSYNETLKSSNQLWKIKPEESSVIVIMIGEREVSKDSLKIHFNVRYGIQQKNLVIVNSTMDALERLQFYKNKNELFPIVILFDLDQKNEELEDLTLIHSYKEEMSNEVILVGLTSVPIDSKSDIFCVFDKFIQKLKFVKVFQTFISDFSRFKKESKKNKSGFNENAGKKNTTIQDFTHDSKKVKLLKSNVFFFFGILAELLIFMLFSFSFGFWESFAFYLKSHFVIRIIVWMISIILKTTFLTKISQGIIFSISYLLIVAVMVLLQGRKSFCVATIFSLVVESYVFYLEKNCSYLFFISSLLMSITYGIELSSYYHFANEENLNYTYAIYVSVLFYIIFIVYTSEIMFKQEEQKLDKLCEKVSLQSFNYKKCLRFMTHEIGNCLVNLDYYIEVMNQLSKRVKLGNSQIQNLKDRFDIMHVSFVCFTDYFGIKRNRFSIVKSYNFIQKNVIEKIERLERLYAKKKNINIKVEDNTEKKIFVEVDERKLHCLVFNMVSNAIKASPEFSEIIVELKTKKKKNSKNFEIWVTNQGNFENYGEIMEYFSPPEKRKLRFSSGFGLYINKMFLDLIGGSIKINEYNGKVYVMASFPIHEEKDINQEEANIFISDNTRAADIKCLLLDDDEQTRDSMGNSLKLQIKEIHTTCSFEQMKKMNIKEYDLIILDNYLNDGTKGIDVAREIRKKTKALIFLISGFYVSGAEDFTDFVGLKPVSGKEIYRQYLILKKKKKL